MNSADNNTLSPDLRNAILDRLGFHDAPAADFAGLNAIYRAWCQQVPFDNLGKVISLRTNGAMLHGIYAVPFFENWLAEGNGATCWPSSNALYALLHSLGFDARRVAGNMLDLGILNHGSVIVTADGTDWLVDSSLLTNFPLPLRRATFLSEDRVFDSEVEFEERSEGETYVVWTQAPSNPTPMPCRIFPAEVSHDLYLQRYEATRERSPFNSRPCARRNCDGSVVMLVGNKRFVKSALGDETRELSSDEVIASLREDFHLRTGVLDRWLAVGGLEAAFEEYTGPTYPLETRKPPSRRG